MSTSEGVKGLAHALAAAQGEFRGIAKDRTADTGSYKYRYVDLASVLDAVRPIMAKNGLSVTQFPSGTHDAPTLKTTLLHESGEYLSQEMPLYLPKKDPQGQGSALTYARRYALCAVLGVASDDDDDGNRAVAARTEEDVAAQEAYREAMAKATELRDVEGNGTYTALLRTLAGDAGFDTVPKWATADPGSVYQAAMEYLDIVRELKAQEAQAEPEAVTPAPAKRTRKRAAPGSAVLDPLVEPNVDPDAIDKAVASLRGTFGGGEVIEDAGTEPDSTG